MDISVLGRFDAPVYAVIADVVVPRVLFLGQGFEMTVLKTVSRTIDRQVDSNLKVFRIIDLDLSVAIRMCVVSFWIRNEESGCTAPAGRMN